MTELMRQNIVDLARAPDRGLVLRNYNDNIGEAKDALTDGFRQYLDFLPSQIFVTEGFHVIEVPLQVRIFKDGRNPQSTVSQITR